MTEPKPGAKRGKPRIHAEPMLSLTIKVPASHYNFIQGSMATIRVLEAEASKPSYLVVTDLLERRLHGLRNRNARAVESALKALEKARAPKSE